MTTSCPQRCGTMLHMRKPLGAALDVTKNLTSNKLWNRSFNQDHSAPWLFHVELFLWTLIFPELVEGCWSPFIFSRLKTHKSASNPVSQWITQRPSAFASPGVLLRVGLCQMEKHLPTKRSQLRSPFRNCDSHFFFRQKELCFLRACYSDQNLGYCCLN